MSATHEPWLAALLAERDDLKAEVARLREELAQANHRAQVLGDAKNLWRRRYLDLRDERRNSAIAEIR